MATAEPSQGKAGQLRKGKGKFYFLFVELLSLSAFIMK
jgi:hypothetical protein